MIICYNNRKQIDLFSKIQTNQYIILNFYFSPVNINAEKEIHAEFSFLSMHSRVIY